MSWHFSRALVEAFSAGTCSDGEPSAPSSGSPTPQAYCLPDRMTACSRLSRYGMTFAPLTDDRGEALLTWFRAGFRARTSALQERAPASTANGPGCGRTWHGSLARFDRVSCSWKTAQRSLLEDSDECSVTWPRSGMTADGLCWELPMSGRRTRGTDSGLWQTPVADDAVNRKHGKWNSRGEPKLSAQVMWPTPVASDTSSRSKPYAQGGTPLSLAVKMWPTPTVCGNYNRKGASATSGDGLATAVSTRTFRTPNASDGAKWSNQSQQEREQKGQQVRLCHQLSAGGRLNPTWVEWLMGWPLAWTDLKPLETDRFRQWQQQHGNCSVERDAA